MRVSRLEVFGFKSFMNRLMLPLEGGITGVVGPNGCGKSNIVDALRWVLGETRASNLRGELLEDVIFNGTDTLRPLGLAEVSISLRSRGENFFADLLTPLDVLRLEHAPSQVASADDVASTNISSRPEGFNAIGLKVIEGSKGKETLNPDQVIDDQEIASEGTNTNESSPLVADSVVADSVAEDSGTDDMASSVAPALLNRFAWLKATSEVQITRRLYRSGESEFFLNRVPCKLKDIKDLLRAVGLGPRSYTIVAQGEIGRIVSARPEERRAIIEEAAGVLGIKERINSAKRRLEETRGNLTRLDDVISEVTRQVNSLKRQASRAEARAELKTRLQQLDSILVVARVAKHESALETLRVSLANLRERERTLTDQVTTRRVEEESARMELSAIEVQGDALRLEVDQIKEEIHSRKRMLLEQESKLNELRGAVKMKREEGLSHQERLDGIRARSGQLELEKSEAQREFDAVSAEVVALEKGSDEELRNTSAALQSARDDLRGADAKLRIGRENLVRAQARLSEIDKQLVSSSPLTQIQKTLGEKSPLTEALKRSSRPLADALRVPADLTTAVRALLGERAGFLVSEDPYEIARITTGGESATKRSGFCLGVMRAGESPEQQSSRQKLVAATDKNSTATLTPILWRVSVAPWGESAALELLGNVLLAESTEQAIAYFSDARDEQGLPIRKSETVVTLRGEIFTADSFFLFNHEGGVLELKVRHEQLTSEMRLLDEEVTKSSGEREAAMAHVELCEQRNKQALAESQARQQAVRALLNRQGNARGRLDATERTLRQTINDGERAAASVKSCAQRVEESEKILASVTANITEMQNVDTSAAEARLAILSNEYKAIDSQRNAIRQVVSSAANTTSDLQRALDDVRREAARSELDQQKLSLECQHVVDSFAQIYGTEILAQVRADPSFTGPLNGESWNDYEQESTAIRNRITREGDVDPTTIEQYKMESERLQQLVEQHADLSKAVATLTSTVESLEKASVERFVNTFNAVAKHFELLVPRLFGGGKGELLLTNPETPLQSGVEILVRPPGKKPKSIESLSGGEKALCATAMIFGMFLVRPSPLCVLDEVDAPLDEANLVRLLTLIKEMSQKTQFLMITHNKESMGMADNLVGVTMQEPGSTQILTVSLQEAYRQVG